MPSNDTAEAQNSTQECLSKQEGFSVSVLATNLSQPHNILYGPDNALDYRAFCQKYHTN
jgi:hypothetical protein